MEIKQDIKNDLFKRQEITGELESEKNPSFEEVQRFIAEKLGKPEENVEVLNIHGGFGKDIFHIDAYVYDSKEDLETMRALRKTKKQRKEEAKAEEEAKVAVKEEAEKPAEVVEENVEGEAEVVEEKPVTADTDVPVEEEAQGDVDGGSAEDKPDEEAKAVKEEVQGKEEAKE